MAMGLEMSMDTIKDGYQEGLYKPDSPFVNLDVRAGFRRKVFGLLTVCLSVTAAITY